MATTLRHRVLRAGLRMVAPAISERVESVAAQRRMVDSLSRVIRMPEGVSMSETELGGRPARHIKPEHGGAEGHLLYLHGGAYVSGGLTSHTPLAALVAQAAGTEAWLLDYRLAPEHPYPAAVEDVWAVTRWVAAHAAELGADPARIAVAGDSAGGNLAAVVALLARDAGVRLRAQLLWYPATTWDTSLASFTENADAPILGRRAVGSFSTLYAADIDLSDPPATLVPARAATLAGVAPAYIAVAGYDPLRDDGIRYAELLAADGVPAQVHNADTLVHGYLGYYGVVPAATEAADLALAALRGALA